jgi:hypothetical protein
VLRSLIAAAALLLAAACAPGIEEPDVADLQSARQAALLFDVRLKQTVLDRLERDEDPVAVYLGYRDAAPQLIAQASEQNGVTLKRTALRVRDPKNAPDDWELEQLTEFDFLIQAGIDPETMGVAEIVEENDQRVFRWIRPLVMTETCLVCHGEEISPRILDMLDQEFPDDEAVGYFANEPGGAYSVRKVLE